MVVFFAKNSNKCKWWTAEHLVLDWLLANNYQRCKFLWFYSQRIAILLGVFFGEVLLVLPWGSWPSNHQYLGKYVLFFFATSLQANLSANKPSPKESSLPTKIWWGQIVKFQDLYRVYHSDINHPYLALQLLQLFRPGDDKAFLVFRSLPAPSSRTF